MNPLFQKAVTAAASAHKLKAEQDYDGACDRAYYAVFHAARVLLTSERKLGENEPKTHRSILRAFSEVFVLAGLVSRDVGRGLKRAERARAKADYSLIPATVEDAEDAIRTMDQIIEFTRSHLERGNQQRGDP
jgi:uncharacterized protein (UPF0332 family)